MPVSSSPHIAIEGLSFALPDGTALLTNLTYTFPRARIGLVGDNGVGKSTLLKLVRGKLHPTAGTIRVRGTTGYLPQALEQEPGESLSGGELVGRALAQVTAARPDFLILDEPTNNLDYEARKALYRFMERTGAGVLAVSHDRELLRRMDLIVEMFPDALIPYGGNYDHYREQRMVHAAALDQDILTASLKLERARQTAQEMKERNERRAREGKRHAAKANLPKIVRGAMKNAAQASAGRNKRLQEGRAETMAANLDALRARRRPDNTIALELPATRVPNGKIVFEVRALTFGYEPSTPLIRDLTYVLIGPRRVALRGRNGSGKSTLVKLLLGQLHPDAGTAAVRIGPTGYLDQSTAGLPPASTLLSMLREVNPGMKESDVRTYLARLKFRREDVHKPVEVLSGGERIRAALAREFLKPEPPQLLILDEPTNNLDLNSIERLESALSNYQGALLVISHDDAFLHAVGIEDEINLGDG